MGIWKCQLHPKKIVLHTARERTLGTSLTIYLVYRAPADKLTTAENNLTTLHSLFLFMNWRCWVCKLMESWFCTSKSSKIFRILLVGRRANLFFKYKVSQNNVIVTSRKQRSLHAAQKLKRHFEARIFSLLQIVFQRPFDLVEELPSCAIYWHTFPHDHPKPRALTICLENSEIPGRIQIRPGGNFPEKKVIPLEVLPSSTLRKHPFLLALPHLQSQKKAPWRRGWILAL